MLNFSARKVDAVRRYDDIVDKVEKIDEFGVTVLFIKHPDQSFK
jgi:hypothetical protein